jgi:hypothetical protein
MRASEVWAIPLGENGQNCVVTTGPSLVHVHFSAPVVSLALAPELAQQLAYRLLTTAVEVIIAGPK